MSQEQQQEEIDILTKGIADYLGKKVEDIALTILDRNEKGVAIKWKKSYFAIIFQNENKSLYYCRFGKADILKVLSGEDKECACGNLEECFEEGIE